MPIWKIYRATRGDYSIIRLSDGREAKLSEEDRIRFLEQWQINGWIVPIVEGLVDRDSVASGEDVPLSIGLAFLGDGETVDLVLVPQEMFSTWSTITAAEWRTVLEG